MVIAGKLSDNSSTVALKVGGNTKNGSLGNIDPAASINIRNSSQGIGLMSYADIQALPEKLWAYLTIRQLEDKRLAASSLVEKKKLCKRMLELSLKYKFVTPVTSMLIVKEKPPPPKKLTHENSSALRTTPPPATRKTKYVFPESTGLASDGEIVSGGVYGDPHFLVSIKGLSVPVCFHILGKKGDILNLLSDTKKGIYIRAEIMEGATNYQSNSWLKTYMRRIVIQTWWITLDINPERIVYNGRVFFWRKENAVTNREINMVINGRGRDLLITLRKGQQFHIKRSIAGKNDKRVKYLDLYLIDGTAISEDTTGILGQMIHVKGRLKNCGKNRKGQTVGKLLIDGGIYSKNKPRLVHAVLNLQQFSLSPEPVSCWIVRDGIRDLVKGNYFSRTISPTVAEK